MNFFEKREKSNGIKEEKTPKGMLNIYDASIEKRWASHAHKNWISNNGKVFREILKSCVDMCKTGI